MGKGIRASIMSAFCRWLLKRGSRDGRLLSGYLWGIILLFMVVISLICLQAEKWFPKSTKQNYNIILMTVTNIGARHMGLYGYHRDTTPHMERFAKESVVFDHFYTPASWTLPSGVSLFTSLPPYQHGVMNRGVYNTIVPVDTLSADIVSLIDILKENGYKTVGFTGGFDYRPAMGLTNRFDQLLGEQINSPLKGLVDEKLLEERRLGSIVDGTNEAIRWIDEHGDQKFFLFLQGYDSHCPFNPKGEFDRYFVDFDASDIQVDPYHCYRKIEEEDGVLTFTSGSDEEAPTGRKRLFGKIQLTQKDLQFLEAQYDAEIRYVDHYIGWFLDQLKQRNLLENSIIIILSEHGEMFAKHGRFGRAGRFRGTLYEDVVHVPLIIRHPQWRPRRVNGLSQMMDIAPTLLDVLNIPQPKGFQGKSLVPLIHRRKNIHQVIYGGSVYGRDDFKYYKTRTINEYARDLEYKLIHEVVYIKGQKKEENYELYHVLTDPQEENNLISSEQKHAEDLKKKLMEWSEKWQREKRGSIKKKRSRNRQSFRSADVEPRGLIAKDSC
jgi:arylsulfatase A-like enzyme